MTPASPLCVLTDPPLLIPTHAATAYANIPAHASPKLWREVPGMILNPRGPLRLALNPHLLKMVPWGLGVLEARAYTPPRVIST